MNGDSGRDTRDEGKEGPKHLIILHHGMWGWSGHMRFVAKRLQDRYGHHVVVYKSSSNAFIRSYHGILVCGYRLMKEVIALRARNPTADRISMIGYSAGGIIVRHTIALLYKSGIIGNGKNQLRPINFVSLATPHCGIRRSPDKFIHRCYNGILYFLVYFLAGDTGQELALIDTPCLEGSEDRLGKFQHLMKKPLLVRMADPDGVHAKALRAFDRKLIYANAINDRMVPYPTASASTRPLYTTYNDQFSAIFSPSLPSPPPARPTDPNLPSYPHILAVTPSKAQMKETGSKGLLGSGAWAVRVEVRLQERVWATMISLLVYAIILTLTPLVLTMLTIFRLLSLLWADPEEIQQAMDSNTDLYYTKESALNGLSSPSKAKRLEGDEVADYESEIAQNLQDIGFYRVDVYLPGLNTHPVIVGRRGRGGEHVIQHLVDHMSIH
uniref:DUF676 domain-containing protein n=1 Tax=Amorphochlora amoebiformis TaxID=1561963 RepID=A0A7S0H9L1_9EUKA|mmetsp:Transcript_8348/g.13053  ORF Transcript_8348/g.13053 Transcript_8348/m.13053 type:complete len:440 (+) Transcript_8348:108-1427(+)